MRAVVNGASMYPYYGFLKCPFCGKPMVKIPITGGVDGNAWVCGGEGPHQRLSERTSCPTYLLKDTLLKEAMKKAIRKLDACEDENIAFGQLYISKDTDSFMRMFLRNYCLRPACYECHAKHYKKSDMTIADFWGIENVAPEMNDGRGTSLVITRTEKGKELFDSIKNELKWKEVGYEEGVKGNPSEYSSVARPQQRDTFFTDLEKMPFSKLKNKYLEGPLWKRTGRKIKRTIKKILAGGGAKK